MRIDYGDDQVLLESASALVSENEAVGEPLRVRIAIQVYSPETGNYQAWRGVVWNLRIVPDIDRGEDGIAALLALKQMLDVAISVLPKLGLQEAERRLLDA